MRTFEGVQGHLATITSLEEDRFIARNFPEAVAHRLPDLPGGDITVAYWLGGFQSFGSGGEPFNDWQWVTGEFFVYTNWASGEPNQYKGEEEDCLHPHPDKGPLWNDASCDRLWGGYVVEYDSTK